MTFVEKFNELTEWLDDNAGIDKYGCWRHYMHYSKDDIYEKCLFIRIPGGTVGNVILDNNNIIKEITLSTDYVVKTYTDDVVELVNKKFAGAVYDFTKDIDNFNDSKFMSRYSRRDKIRKRVGLLLTINFFANLPLEECE